MSVGNEGRSAVGRTASARFLDELLQRSTKTAMSCDFSFESTKANSRPLCDTTDCFPIHDEHR